MNQIKNFRDIGGYFTADNRQMKWGEIYRSGNLSNATLYDQEKIRRLNIRTVIDFRSNALPAGIPFYFIPPSVRSHSTDADGCSEA